MFINYTVTLPPFPATWDAISFNPSSCVWMVPGTFDCDGNSIVDF